jgi:HK97 family phage major capsid protein
VAEKEEHEMTTPQQQIEINKGIVEASAEANALSKKKSLTKMESRRLDTLLSRIATLKAGFSLDEALQREFNEYEQSEGRTVTQFEREGDAETRAISKWMLTGETRAEGVGSPVFTNLNGNVGSFVPLQFYRKIVSTLRQHSPLFDPENVTYIETKSGNPLQLPFISDIENVATVIGEGTDDSGGGTDISSVGGKFVLTYAYRTPKEKISYEADQDIPNLTPLLQAVFSQRLAVGAGIDLIKGNGTNKPLGLVPSVTALGAIVVAAGSSQNTGGTETGANSIGPGDIANLFFSVPAPYRRSPKFAFIMNSTTALFLSRVYDKMGRPILDLDDDWTLYGKPVLIDESLDNIGASNVPVLAGDLSYWVTRVATGNMYLQRYTQGVGLAENGMFAVNLFGRAGGALMFNDTSAPSPIWALQNHS